jgi:hypothetical protein
MRTSSTKNSLIIGISIVLGASLLSVGVSNAAGSTIKACAKKSNGAMRLIDSSKNCKKSERTLTWGTQGDAGATGATGAAGSTGATGATGSNGSNGYSRTYSHEFTSNSSLELSNDLGESSLQNELWLNSIPAGNYTFSVSAQVNYSARTSHAGHAYLKCMLSSSGDYSTAAANISSVFWPSQHSSGEGRSYQLSFQPITANTEQISNLSAVSTISLASATNLRFVCAMDQGKRSPETTFDETMTLNYLTLIFTAVDTDTAVTMELRP